MDEDFILVNGGSGDDDCLAEDAPCDSPTLGTGLDEERCVPGGTYTMGADAIPILPHMVSLNTGGDCTAAEIGTIACEASYRPGPRNDWAPKHQVWLSPYFIDTFEVTNGRYKECVTAGACAQAGGEELDNPLSADSPVVFVTWSKAYDYCLWRGRRLPTEAEWEVAARGKKAFQWPWGDTPPNSPSPGFAPYPAPAVGTDSRDISPFGIHDMLGGVSEWVNDWYAGPYSADTTLVKNPQGPAEAPTGYVKCCKENDWRRMFSWSRHKSVRGTGTAAPGGYELNQLDRAYPLWVRDYNWDDDRYGDLGFRCARDGRAGQASQALQSVPTHKNLAWRWYGDGGAR